jgi:HAD superfamily 5'-nucleotidase-like hydrolase
MSLPGPFDDDESPALLELLAEGGLERKPPRARRIFTNRDLALEDIPVVGFDMDYTLALYRQDALEALSIECTVDKLIGRGYPESLRGTSPDPRFAIRGLTVDRALGNVLKLDRHGYVGRGYHGRAKLDATAQRDIYRAQRLGQERDRFVPVDTLFALPEVTLYAEVVEMIDGAARGDRAHAWPAAGPPTYAEAFRDVRECIDEAHRDGSLKQQIAANPGRYIYADPELARTLHKLRSAGKRLFVLTNSLYPYTDVVLTFLLGQALPSYPDWHAYFDWMIVGASKPGFFTDGRPFLELDRQGHALGVVRSGGIQRGKLYQEGNQAALQQALAVHPDQVLYVGDHIYGDIVRSKKSSGWRTALVVQELEHDLAVRRDRAVQLEEIEALYDMRARLAERLSDLRARHRAISRLTPERLLRHEPGLTEAAAALAVERLAATARAALDAERRYYAEVVDLLERRSREVDAAFNPYWGSAFAERHDTSRLGAQVEFYADVYTSRVSNLLYVSPTRYFRAPHGSLPHWQSGR